MKKRETVLWFFTFLALLVGICACSARPKNYIVSESDGGAYEVDEYIVEISKVFEMIKRYYVEEVDSQKLYEGALRGMVAALEDPHSTYWDKETFEAAQKGMIRGDFGGVGLYINKPNPASLTAESLITDFYINVVAPIRGTPGYRADIHAGDFITHIDGESVAELTSDEAVGKLTGEVGTDVMLTILRGKGIVFDVTLTRAKIEVPSCESAMLDNGIAYLRILSWTQHTAKAVEEALSTFKKVDYTKLIVDLRENGGGLLDSATEISNFFLSDGTIVSTRYREDAGFTDQVIEANSYQTKVPKDVEVVVLIDKGTASASEIFAGALQDSKRATLIGSTSFGKGSVQVPFALGYEDSLKITVGRYYTPLGKNIDQVGITPDIEVPVEEYSDEELISFATLLNDKLIDLFLEENPVQEGAPIEAFLKELKEKEIVLEERLIRKLIRNKYDRKMDFPPVYDLEFDLTLQEAVEFFSNTDET